MFHQFGQETLEGNAVKRIVGLRRLHFDPVSADGGARQVQEKVSAYSGLYGCVNLAGTFVVG
jgi:hypothetical protein